MAEQPKEPGEQAAEEMEVKGRPHQARDNPEQPIPEVVAEDVRAAHQALYLKH